ncbi:UDP-N-acetylglucosamine 1-carboxyvinyltransferase [Yinghuangia seranimata]|uniref:UDP-N-acetylglucosamine 1-carboxyvinyltransferase n=1 Tax=Yinghuangia seranimata TaxID=408067 RepID=UPI00248D218D|nr:UDP-N-acetylglucosamine 1-carboxyvinyltransferase [Yinghuangia seranimata]MDI2127158.1 UDP-N-acetylglucosamine 1-carboxyvinyltransferase [Yinghuangia seranimata]
MTAAPVIAGVHAIAVRPGRPLSGSVSVDGSKNAALPLLAAAAAVRRPVQVDRVPAIGDVEHLLSMLAVGGFQITRPVDRAQAIVVRPGARPDAGHPSFAQAAAIRASYYLVPALLASFGQARLPWPGGCAIGDRGMDLHFDVYSAFGDAVAIDEYGYQVTATPNVPTTVRIDLPFRSRGASVVAVLRAIVSDTRLILGNPNQSPEFVGMCIALRAAGWQIDTDTGQLVLTPHPAEAPPRLAWTVAGDKVEAATLACAVAATGGSARIEGVCGADVAPVADALNRLGIPTQCVAEGLLVHAADAHPTGAPLRAVASLEPGGLDADFEPALIALALGQRGTHLFADDINPGRHGNLLPQLARLGADIEELSPTRCRLTGPQKLVGARLAATDIRTGSAVLIAALSAHGASTVTNLDQLRRGHPDLPAKLRQLGADITPIEVGVNR